MARINFNDSIEADNRFQRLVRKLGSDDTARGMLIRFWRTAQRYWADGFSLVPEEEFIADGFLAILESGLAERREGGIYAKGAEEQFAWYAQQKQKSVRGGEATKRKWAEKKEGPRRPAGLPNKPGNEAVGLAPEGPVPGSLSLAPSLAPSLALKNKELRLKDASLRSASGGGVGIKVKSTPVQYTHKRQIEVAKLIAAYTEAYSARYGGRPECLGDGKTIGLIQNFLRNRSLERATALVQAYCQMEGDGGWFTKQRHDFVTLTQKINQVADALHRGEDPGKKRTTMDLLNELEESSDERSVSKADGETKLSVR